MEVVIKAINKSSIIKFIGRVCGDLFPQGIAIDDSYEGQPSIVKFSDEQEAIGFTPDPTAVIYLEVPKRVIQLATAEGALSLVDRDELDTFLSGCSLEQRAEVRAARRIMEAKRSFSVVFLEVARYLPPNT